MVRQVTRSKVNDMNDCSSGGAVSSGRDCYEHQVTPDRHQATGHKSKSINIATWNVRTMWRKGKLDNIKKEMERLNISVLGLNEVRWERADRIKSGKHSIIYSGGDKRERGVGIILNEATSTSIKGYWTISDKVLLVKLSGKSFDITIIQVYASTSESTEEDIDLFYKDLETAKNHCKSQDVIIIMGDFNVKVGNERVDEVVGDHGLGQRNERRERLIDWVRMHDMIIGNIWFKYHPRKLWTWKSPGDNSKNQIDYITTNKRFRNSLLTVKTMPGADYYTDHVLLFGNIRVKLKKIQKAPGNTKLDLVLLKTETDIRESFNVAVRNRYSTLEPVQDLEDR